MDFYCDALMYFHSGVDKVFQARFQEAGSEVGRFLLNTTLGVAGFVDVASRVGLEKAADRILLYRRWRPYRAVS
jgi:phospholipid-binding lipoprotein MlaA